MPFMPLKKLATYSANFANIRTANARTWLYRNPYAFVSCLEKLANTPRELVKLVICVIDILEIWTD